MRFTRHRTPCLPPLSPLSLTFILATGLNAAALVDCPPEHLSIAQQVQLGCCGTFCFQCAQQGVAADPAGTDFYTSTGANFFKDQVLARFNSNWMLQDTEVVNYTGGINHIGDITVVGNFVYAPIQGNNRFNGNINLLHIAWFDKTTLDYVSHTNVIELDTLFDIGDGGLAGVAHHDGKLYVVEWQEALPDSPTPHIFIFNLLGNGALDMSNYSDFAIPTRYANGIEIVGKFALVSYGSASGDDAGSIGVFDLNDLSAGPIFTWTYDVVTWHAEGLTFANGELWVCQGDDVYRLNTNSAPSFPEGLIEDCFGNCAPAEWVGDGVCDDGSDSWNGNLIHFDCDDFNCDGGDCDCDGGGSDYIFCCSAMCLDADRNAPYDCFDATPTVGIDDDRVYAWFRLSETCVPIFGARWEWFRPDGSLSGDVTDDGSCIPVACDGPCTWWWWIPIAGTGNADWAGVWQVKMYVDAGSGWEYVTTEQFVMSYDLTEHLMCEDVQKGSPWDPINATNTFYQSNEKAVSWVNLDLVANALDVKWEWHEPNGKLFHTGTYNIPDPDDIPDCSGGYCDYFRTWYGLDVAGEAAANKCGQWEVQFYVKDPFGNWELEYTDGFQILEDPNVDPTVTVVAKPKQPLEGEPISINVSANDNTYLHHVTLQWSDGQWHQEVIDEIFSGSFGADFPIGSFPAGQEIWFYAEAVDTSGNVTLTETQKIIVQSLCGNGVPDPGETCSNCPQDVGPCVGACCFVGPECTLDTQAGCQGAGGIYQGDGTNCGGVNCRECLSNSDCDDGDPCNGIETCVGEVCQPGTPPNCDDGDPCTDDSCDPGTGNCVNTPITPCCGNGVVDPGEDCSNCPTDVLGNPMEHKLLASDAAPGDFFGFSVTISGTTAIVGAHRDDDNGTNSGSAYLFDTTTGDQIAKLLPDDGETLAKFGYSVAISGETAIVGAYSDGAYATGSAYLFDTTTGAQIVKLLANDGAFADHFGISVGISGATAIVGAWYDDDYGSESGSAYLFDTTTGDQIAKLLPNDGAAQDRFGTSVAISGTTAIVGAPFDDDNGETSGSAYLFDTTTGDQIAKLLPDDGVTLANFGYSVAISGTTAIVGAYLDGDNGNESGSAYMFDTTTGAQIAKLLPNDGAPGDVFGFCVGISGATAIVGAYLDDDNGSASGSAYLFDTTTGVQIAKLLPDDGAADDLFGGFVGISGATAIVGAPGDDDNGTDSGSAYVYRVSAFIDCNGNGQPNLCDIADGTSQDANGNGIPDECEFPADLTGPLGVPDGCVDAFDLGAMLGAWCSGVNDPNPPSPPCENCTPANLAIADISGAANVPDGCVDAFDLAKLLAEWCSVAGGNPCGTCGP